MYEQGGCSSELLEVAAGTCYLVQVLWCSVMQEDLPALTIHVQTFGEDSEMLAPDLYYHRVRTHTA